MYKHSVTLPFSLSTWSGETMPGLPARWIKQCVCIYCVSSAEHQHTCRWLGLFREKKADLCVARRFRGLRFVTRFSWSGCWGQVAWIRFWTLRHFILVYVIECGKYVWLCSFKFCVLGLLIQHDFWSSASLCVRVHAWVCVCACLWEDTSSYLSWWLKCLVCCCVYLGIGVFFCCCFHAGW